MMMGGTFARIDQLRVRSRLIQERIRRQTVIDDNIGLPDTGKTSLCHQVQIPRAGSHQPYFTLPDPVSHFPSQRSSLLRISTGLPAAGNSLRVNTIRRIQRFHIKGSILHPGKRRGRSVAASSDSGQVCPFRAQADIRLRIIDPFQDLFQVQIAVTALHSQDRLSCGGQADRWIQMFKEILSAGRHLQTLKACGGQDDRVIPAFRQLSQSGLYIPPDHLYLNQRIYLADLQLPAKASGTHHASRFQVFEACPVQSHDYIFHRSARQRRADPETFGKFHRHVFGAVHCQVNLPPQQGVFQFLGKDAFSSERCERPVQLLVTLRRQLGNLHFQVRKCFQDLFFHYIGLDQGEHALPGPYTYLLLHDASLQTVSARSDHPAVFYISLGVADDDDAEHVDLGVL